MKFLLVFLVIALLIYFLCPQKAKVWASENRIKLGGFLVASFLVIIILLKGQAGLAAITAAIIAFGERLWRFRNLFATLLQFKNMFGAKKFKEEFIHSNSERRSPLTDGPLSAKKAGEILGIDPSASKKEIRNAHRKLISKLHPDKEGNDYLASLLNNARDVLLDKNSRRSDESHDRKT